MSFVVLQKFISNFHVYASFQHFLNRSSPLDVRRKLNVLNTFRRRPGRLLNVLCMSIIYFLRPGGYAILIVIGHITPLSLHLNKSSIRYFTTYFLPFLLTYSLLFIIISSLLFIIINLYHPQLVLTLSFYSECVINCSSFIYLIYLDTINYSFMLPSFITAGYLIRKFRKCRAKNWAWGEFIFSTQKPSM